MSSREELLLQLEAYSKRYPEEGDTVKAFSDFVCINEDCFERSNSAGHVTASAWITSPDGGSVVLLHHAKLGRWLQPGGHADGDANLIGVARREAFEETGLEGLKLCSSDIHDIDIHYIPARGGLAEHYHYDVRFHFEAPEDVALRQNHESHRVAWVETSSLKDFTEEISVLRMGDKLGERGRRSSLT